MLENYKSDYRANEDVVYNLKKATSWMRTEKDVLVVTNLSTVQRVWL
jgi:hypothetical protein